MQQSSVQPLHKPFAPGLQTCILLVLDDGFEEVVRVLYEAVFTLHTNELVLDVIVVPFWVSVLAKKLLINALCDKKALAPKLTIEV